MTPPRAITIRLAEPRDAQAIGMMSRDYVEAGMGRKYDAARVLRAIRDRETLAVVACERGKSSTSRGAVTGFAIMELGDERAHLEMLAVRPAHRRLGIGQRRLAAHVVVGDVLAVAVEVLQVQISAGRSDAQIARALRKIDQQAALAGGPDPRHAGGDPLAARVVAGAPVDIAAVGCDVGIV